MAPVMIGALDVAQTMSETIESHHWSVVTFLKHGALLPARRYRRLFLELFAVSAALLPAAFCLFKRLALTSDAAVAADHYVSPRDMDFVRISRFMEAWLLSDHHRLLPLAYLVAGITVGLVTYIATVSATVVARGDDSPQVEELKDEVEVVEEDDGEEEEDKEVDDGDSEEEDKEVDDVDSEEENDEGEDEEVKKDEQEHHTLLSFLGTAVKSNLVRPAKIIALSCSLKAALAVLLGFAIQVHDGALRRNEFIYPAAIFCLLVEFVFKVAAVASIAEEPAGGQSAVGRACRLVRGKYKELLLCHTGQVLIQHLFNMACAVVAMVRLPQPVDASVMCLLLGAKEVLSVANMTGYYFACKEKEEREQNRECHLD